MSFFLINDIRLNLPMGRVPFQMLYLGPFSNVRYNRTDGTDAFDTLCIGCKKFPFHDSFSLSMSGVLYMGHRTKRLMLRSVDFDESLLISVS